MLNLAKDEKDHQHSIQSMKIVVFPANINKRTPMFIQESRVRNYS